MDGRHHSHPDSAGRPVYQDLGEAAFLSRGGISDILMVPPEVYREQRHGIGLELWNKLVLSLGRIAAVALFIWFVMRVRMLPTLRVGFFVAMSLVIAGAAGNIFDCVFYGKLFNNPMPPEVAVAFPPGGGYAGWFEGRVVDMLYFPLFSFNWPEWVPFVGGDYFEFFQFIFNIADSSICIGVCLLIFFYSGDASKAFQYIGEKGGGSRDSRNK